MNLIKLFFSHNLKRRSSADHIAIWSHILRCLDDGNARDKSSHTHRLAFHRNLTKLSWCLTLGGSPLINRKID